MPTYSSAGFKELQRACSFVALESLFEAGDMDMKSQNSFMYTKFHGKPNDLDSVSIYSQMASGAPPFANLWDEDQEVAGIYGSATKGYSKASLKKGGSLLSVSTGFTSTTPKVNNDIQGVKLRTDAVNTLKALKIMSAHWKTTLASDGSFKSGCTEVNSALSVRQLCYAEQRSSTIDVDDNGGGDSGDDDGGGEKDGGGGGGEKDKKGDDEDDEDDDGKDSRDPLSMPKSYYPPHYLAFILFGPYSKAAFGTAQSIILAYDPSDLDKKAAKKSRAASRTVAKVEAHVTRTIEADRGATSIQQGVIDRSERQLSIAAETSRMTLLRGQLVSAREFLSESTTAEETSFYQDRINVLKIQIMADVDFEKFRHSAPPLRSTAFETPVVAVTSVGARPKLR